MNACECVYTVRCIQAETQYTHTERPTHTADSVWLLYFVLLASHYSNMRHATGPSVSHYSLDRFVVCLCISAFVVLSLFLSCPTHSHIDFSFKLLYDFEKTSSKSVKRVEKKASKESSKNTQQQQQLRSQRNHTRRECVSVYGARAI